MFLSIAAVTRMSLRYSFLFSRTRLTNSRCCRSASAISRCCSASAYECKIIIHVREINELCATQQHTKRENTYQSCCVYFYPLCTFGTFSTIVNIAIVCLPGTFNTTIDTFIIKPRALQRRVRGYTTSTYLYGRPVRRCRGSRGSFLTFTPLRGRLIRCIIIIIIIITTSTKYC